MFVEGSVGKEEQFTAGGPELREELLQRVLFAKVRWIFGQAAACEVTAHKLEFKLRKSPVCPCFSTADQTLL